MIHVDDINFAYDDASFTLRVDELAVAAGQRVVCTGPSGSGKTTLLHIIAGILQPAVGRVECCGSEWKSLPESARRDLRISRIGLVLQEFELLDYLDVFDNILLAYRINRSLQLNSAARERAQRLAAALGLDQLLTRRPKNLSHGERQRVAVCRALVTEPQVVLADEPTASLDDTNTSRVLDALDHHVEQHHAALVVTTHDTQLTTHFDEQIDIGTLSDHSHRVD